MSAPFEVRIVAQSSPATFLSRRQQAAEVKGNTFVSR